MKFFANHSILRRTLKTLGCLTCLFALFIGGILLWFFSCALVHRFYTFPREAHAWEALRAQRKPVSIDDGWTEYRGICHSHSLLSHDSRIPWSEILEAAKTADVNFLCMSDHPVDGKADFSLQWKGLHDGILFIRGFELSNGLLVWGLPDDTVLDISHPIELTAHEVHQKGGLVFFAHTEEKRPWNMPDLDGMEIYNIHTDFKDEKFLDIIPDMLLNESTYGDQTLRLIYDRHPDIFARWDSMNKTRRITGIGANDAHRNIGINGSYTWRDTLLVNDNSGAPLREWHLNRLTRGLLRLCFGPLDADRELFRVTKDPYERSLRYVNTHILAHALNEHEVLDALQKGRVFVAFDMIADARTFKFFAEAAGRKAVMGETLPLNTHPVLHAASPIPGRFTLLRDGEQLQQSEGAELKYTVDRAGKYRVEVELLIAGIWTPWIYANPIEISN